jgi:glycosyltransferase involved in cell wall biosynthesis
MKRIAIVSTSYPATPGDPSGHFVEAEARRLEEDGQEVTVFAPVARREPGFRGELVCLSGSEAFGWPGALARIRKRPWRAVAAAAFVVHARRALRTRGPFDRIVAHFVVPSAWPAAIAETGELEVVGHGSDVRLLAKLPGRTSIVRALLARGARFRFSSNELAELLAEATTADLRRASVVRLPALDLRRTTTRSAARAALGLTTTESLSVVVGRLVREKRVDRAIHFALSLDEHGRVFVVGDGPLSDALRARYPNVTFLGCLPRPEALAWIAAADRLVSASLLEGAPTAVREALALGVSVIAAPVGDLRQWARSEPLLDIREALAQ